MGYNTYYTIDILNADDVCIAEMLKAFKVLFIECKEREDFYGGALFNYRARDFDDLINSTQSVFNEKKKYKIVRYLFSKERSLTLLMHCGDLFRIDDSTKWYTHEDHMIWLSSKTPNIVWSLHGEGEESGDLWYKYFKAGKMQEAPARIEYDDYDERKLR